MTGVAEDLIAGVHTCNQHVPVTHCCDGHYAVLLLLLTPDLPEHMHNLRATTLAEVNHFVISRYKNFVASDIGECCDCCSRGLSMQQAAVPSGSRRVWCDVVTMVQGVGWAQEQPAARMGPLY
jgi:hypothetical protein